MTMVKRGIWSRVVSLPHGGVFPQSKIRQGIELRRIVAQANSIQESFSRYKRVRAVLDPIS